MILLKKFNYEIKKFIFIGIVTVCIDFLIYSILINLNLYISFAKGTSFIFGALFSYFGNKKYTFKATGGSIVFLRFIVIYLSSLILNILTNNIFLNLLVIKNSSSLILAFILSTLISAIFNFIGLKKLVFKEKN